MEAVRSEFRTRLDGIQNEQLKHTGEIVCLCVECERLQLENKDLRRRITLLEERLDRIEDDRRQNNLLFCGLHEGENESIFDCEQKVLRLIHRVLGIQKEVPIERVYRTGTAITVQFLSRKDRDFVLSSARCLRGSKFSVREDVSPGVGEMQKGLHPSFTQQRKSRRKGTKIHHENLVRDKGALASDFRTEHAVDVGDTGALDLSGHFERASVSASGGSAARQLSPLPVHSDCDQLGPTDGKRQARGGTIDDVKTSGPVLTNGNTSSRELSSVCLKSHKQQPGSCDNFDMRDKDSGEDSSVCWEPSDSGTSSENRHNSVERVISKESKSPDDEITNSDVGLFDKELDADVHVAIVKSPLSTYDGTEMLEEMSIDSGISTLTASMMSQFSGWGLSQSFQPASQSGSHSWDVTQLTTLSSSLVFPGYHALSDGLKAEAAAADVGDPDDFVDSTEREGKYVNGDRLGRRCGSHVNVKDAQAGGDISSSSSDPREGGELDIEYSSGNDYERWNGHTSRRGPGIGWFSYLEGGGMHVEKGLHQLTSELKSPRKGRHIQGCPVKEETEGSHTSFDSPRSEGNVHVNWNSPRSGECKDKDSLQEQPAGNQIHFCAQPGGSVHISNDNPRVGDWNHSSCDRTEIYADNCVSRIDSTRGSTRVFSSAEADDPIEQSSHPGNDKHFRVFENPQGARLDDSSEGRNLSDSSCEDIVPDDDGPLGRRTTVDGHSGLVTRGGNVDFLYNPYGRRVHNQLRRDRVHDSPQGRIRDESQVETVSDSPLDGKVAAEGEMGLDSPQRGRVHDQLQRDRVHYSPQGRIRDESQVETVSESPLDGTVDAEGEMGLDSPQRGRVHDQLCKLRFPDSPQGRGIHDQIQAETVSDIPHGKKSCDQGETMLDNQRGGKVLDQLQREESLESPQGRRNRDQAQTETVSDSLQGGNVHFQSQTGTVLDSSRGGRVHDQRQRERVPDSPQGRRILEQVRAEAVTDSPRERKVHDQILGETVLDVQSGRRVPDQCQGKNVPSSLQGRKIPYNLPGETVLGSAEGVRVPDSSRCGRVLDSHKSDGLQDGRVSDGACFRNEGVQNSSQDDRMLDVQDGTNSLFSNGHSSGFSREDLHQFMSSDTGSTKTKLDKLSGSLPAHEADRDVGWHRSGGQWQYCHKRSIADAGLHPANQGALIGKMENEPPAPAAVSINGLGPTSGEGDAHQQEEEDHISRKLTEMQDSILLPIKEDLSEWITRITGVEITPDTFIEMLDSGVVLCTISKLIEKHAQEYAKEGKLTEPLPEYKLRCNSKAKSGTWFSRDNVTNFLGWCRAYGMTDETMFDSEDLVSHKQEKPVVNCVLELARIGWKYGIEPPNLIRMEREIEKESKEFEPPPFIPKPVEIVKQKPVEKPVEKKPEKPDLHKEVKRVAFKCKCQEYVNRISEGVYDVFGKRVFIRLLHGKHLMVRVGGGWDTFENYLLHHDPIQVYEFRRPASRDNHRDNFDGYLVIKSKYKS